MRLSVAMIVKNESAMLKDCLESVKDADEIVIIDTGSEDNTVEIAKQYTNLVYTDYKWEDNFANARNHAISKCTGDWILSIDADNILEEGGIKKLKDAIYDNPEQYSLDIRFVSQQGNAIHSIPYVYKRCAEVFFKGAAHNYLSKGANIHSEVTIFYKSSPAHKKDPNRTLRILKKEVEKHPTKPREIYYLAREYRYRKMWIESLYWCNEYLKYAFWGPEIADCQLMKARCLWNLNRGEEARDACLAAIKVNIHFKEAILFMAEMTNPENRDNWLFMAEIATNRNVLFARQKPEQPPSYYEAINDTEPRYTNIYEMVGKMVGNRRMLDIGCGQGALKEHIAGAYFGFDHVSNPYLVADLYTHDYGDYDVYVLLEVLEHLLRDIEVIKKIPTGKDIIFSVPSFDCPAHVRMYTEQTIYWRYKDLIKLESIARFNFDYIARKWKTDIPNTTSYILLCQGKRV